MKRIKTVLLVALALWISIAAVAADKTLTASEAKDHIGERATVCGTVASTRYAASSKGSPTFVNLEKPYPNQAFTILIWGEDLPRFTVKPSSTISSYRGAPEIVAKSPEQISFPQSSSSAPLTEPGTATASSCPSSDYYVNTAGQCVHRPVQSDTVPAGATAQCRDGTYSFSQSRRGTCSHHGGVARWL